MAGILRDERLARALPWVGAVCMALLAFGATWRATPTGPFGSTDSQTYLAVAANLAAGHGLTTAFTNEYDGVAPHVAIERAGRHPLLLWPPLYPVALAAGTPVGVDPPGFARFVGAAGAAATALLTVRLGRRLTGSTLAGMVITGLFLVNVSTQLLFATISSEAVYTPLLIGGVLALVRAIDEPDARHLALFAAVAAATALTRYTGVGLIVTGWLSLRLWLPLATPDRARRAWLFAAAAAAPLALWTAATRLGIEASNRSLGWHDRVSELGDFAGLVAEWVLPADDLTGAARTWIVVAVAIVAGVALLAWLRLGGSTGSENQALRAAGPAALAVFGHLGFVVASALLLDRTLALDHRMLMPVVPIAMGLIAGGPAWWLRNRVPIAARWALAGLVLVVVGLCGMRLGEVAGRIIVFSDLPGVLDPQVDEATRGALEAIPESAVVFSNSPTALYALANRGSMALPYRQFPMSGADNDAYPADLRRFGELLTERDGWVVWYVPTAALIDYLAPESAVVDAASLELVASSPAVRVYRTPTD